VEVALDLVDALGLDADEVAAMRQAIVQAGVERG
jgi:hypothetical protein